MYQFLSSLPAILGVVGFVVFLLLRRRIFNVQTLEHLMSGLKQGGAVLPQDYKDLTPAKAKLLIAADAATKQQITKEQQQTLRLLVTLEFAITALVFLVCLALFILGVWLYTNALLRTEPSQQVGPSTQVSTISESVPVTEPAEAIPWIDRGEYVEAEGLQWLKQTEFTTFANVQTFKAKMNSSIGRDARQWRLPTLIELDQARRLTEAGALKHMTGGRLWSSEADTLRAHVLEYVPGRSKTVRVLQTELAYVRLVRPIGN